MSYEPLAISARIGLIVPSSNQMSEPHFYRYAPDSVVTHTTRLRMTGKHRMKLAELTPHIAEAAIMLADSGCDPIVFHCTANSMGEGVAAEQTIVRTIADATGVRATTTASATMAALKALDARRIVLVSPYVRATHEHEIEFLTEAGIEIVGERNLGLENSGAYVATPASVWLDTLRELQTERADSYFVSCANIRAMEMLDEMEALLDRPVLTSNQVALWHALRLAGIDDPIAGIGRLLNEQAAVLAS
ncbi:MAG: maleate cis-trans isomerase family protein [Alphaproteobacteria bacterium]